MATSVSDSVSIFFGDMVSLFEANGLPTQQAQTLAGRFPP